MKKLAIVAALAALGAASQANAAFTSISVDPDGAGGAYGTISITSLNWLAGNAVAVGAGGLAGQSLADYNTALATTGETIHTYYQAQLNTFVSNSGGSSTTYTPVGQWTVVADIVENQMASGAASVSLTPVGGTVSIYYNATKTANDITGTGFTDGTKILQGSIVGGSGSFQNTTALNDLLVSLGLIPSNPTPITQLDNFGADNKPGVQSIQGNGQSTLKVDIGATAGDFVDANFFKTNITTFDFLTTGIEDANDTGQLVDPFNQANPSAVVNGYTPVYGAGNVNGVLAPVSGGVFTQNSDFQFQTTNVTSFNAIPEPSTLAIAGLGMTGLMLRRRKSA